MLERYFEFVGDEQENQDSSDILLENQSEIKKQ